MELSISEMYMRVGGFLELICHIFLLVIKYEMIPCDQILLFEESLCKCIEGNFTQCMEYTNGKLNSTFFQNLTLLFYVTFSCLSILFLCTFTYSGFSGWLKPSPNLQMPSWMIGSVFLPALVGWLSQWMAKPWQALSSLYIWVLWVLEKPRGTTSLLSDAVWILECSRDCFSIL